MKCVLAKQTETLWEYYNPLTPAHSPMEIDELDLLGKKGWELVSFTYIHHPEGLSHSKISYIFKKP